MKLINDALNNELLYQLNDRLDEQMYDRLPEDEHTEYWNLHFMVCTSIREQLDRVSQLYSQLNKK